MVADVLTVAVFEADLFDDVFGGLVSVNAEGQVVGDDAAVGFAFVEHVVQNLADESMQAAGSAVLRLAWSMRRSVVSD
jgi:carbon monoxide dehydrogenase subunit G